jgi:hypothetical protein
MNLENGTLTIDAKANNEALCALAKEIVSSADALERIVVDDSEGVESSALFALLCSVRNSYPKVAIELLDTKTFNLSGIGLMSLKIGK